jgi:hypothetical protein
MAFLFDGLREIVYKDRFTYVSGHGQGPFLYTLT